VKGGFPKLVLKEKQDFVNLYGPKSQYIAKHEAQKAQVFSQLKEYYVELAAHFHSQGQQALKKAKTSKEEHLSELASTSLLQAADYYGRYLEAFPGDKKVAELRYKKADAHFENKQYDLAAKEYATVAYVDKDKKLANKSAYASLIAYRKHSEVLEKERASAEKQEAWRQQSVDSMLKFANVFHKDKRAIAVLTNAAQALFALSQFDRAIDVANGLIKNNKQLNPSLKQTAYGILAHSYFQKGEYQIAQNHYTTQRRILLTQMKVSKQSDEYKDISNQIAASIYKKSEAHKLANNNQLAIYELLSVKKLAPQSKIRVIAQYDAVSLMLQGKQWSSAIKELKQLQKQFPQHELAVEFPRKLAFAYEKSEQWKKAAFSYTQLFKTDKDPVVRQDALFIAAGLYEKIGDSNKAIVFYKDYAHKYEKPFDNRMEARYHLADLYDKTNDKTRHLFWLRRVIAGDAEAGADRTERSQWLGGWANAKYGDYFAWEFNRRSLRLPLDKSMAKKNGYLQDATVRYENAAQYGILEFVTLSNFKMADLYETFSKELNKAPIPGGL
jgi:tetratricopeptide (TPR) repeat protein